MISRKKQAEIYCSALEETVPFPTGGDEVHASATAMQPDVRRQERRDTLPLSYQEDISDDTDPSTEQVDRYLKNKSIILDENDIPSIWKLNEKPHSVDSYSVKTCSMYSCLQRELQALFPVSALIFVCFVLHDYMPARGLYTLTKLVMPNAKLQVRHYIEQ